MDDTRNAMPVTKMRRNSMPVDAMYMDMAQQHALRSSMMSAAQQQQYMMAAQEQQQQYMMAAQQQQYMMAQQQYMMGRQQEVPLGACVFPLQIEYFLSSLSSSIMHHPKPGDWLQGQFQSDPTTMPDVTATPLVMTAVDAVDKTGNISHAAGMGSATSSTETNTPQYLPGEEAVAPAWSPFAAAQVWFDVCGGYVDVYVMDVRMNVWACRFLFPIHAQLTSWPPSCGTTDAQTSCHAGHRPPTTVGTPHKSRFCGPPKRDHHRHRSATKTTHPTHVKCCSRIGRIRNSACMGSGNTSD